MTTTIPTLSGNTRLFATLGHPVAQIRTPRVMPAVFAHLGLDAVWLPIDATADGLPAVLAALKAIRNFDGLTVTVPHKAAVLALLDSASPRARAAGGVNLVRATDDGRLIGDMVDGTGFVRGLAAAGMTVAGRTAWMIGTGGAGSAIAAALAEADLARLFVADRDPARVNALAARLASVFPSMAVSAAPTPPPGVDFAINATPAGMRPDDPLPFDPAPLAPDTVVCDVIMKPPVTALLARAAARGLRTQPGLPMLDWQVPLYLAFFGIAAPDPDRLVAIAAGA